MNSTGKTQECSRCHWHIFPKDIFCGGCAYQLAKLTVTPDPDKDLGGAPWTIFSGIPITLKVKNEGVNPIEIQELKAEGFEITHSNIELPYSLDADETSELRCSHNAHERSIGRLELLSSLSSIKPVDFFIRCEKAPEISLVSEDGPGFEHGTDEYQPCAIDPVDGRISLRLRHDLPLRLQAVPYLSEGEDYFVISGLLPDQKFPEQLSPEHPLKFSLTRRQDFEETCPAVINFSFDSLGEIIFKLLLRYVDRPKLGWEFSRQFTNDQALVSGGKRKINFTVTVNHLSGPPFRITQVESSQPWLSVKSHITEQDSVLIDDSSSQIDLILNQDNLPTVEDSTTVEVDLDIQGSTVGEGETFHEPISLRVQIRPPQPLEFPIAVDFGTTNSCIAYMDPQDQNRKKLLELELGEDVSEIRISEIPTIFQFLAIKKPSDLIESSADGIALDERWMPLENEALVRFGHTLKRQRFDPEDIRSISWGFKGTLRTPDDPFIYNDQGTGSIRVNGRVYEQGNRYIEVDAIEKVGLYIRFLLESFKENTGYLPTEAVFTYPAVFNRQKEILRKAIAWATQGMDIKSILDISEPEAIALDYALDIATKQDSDRDIVYGVFDCGGGTTDISIVRLKHDESLAIEILASDGDNALGGDLLSFKIAQYLYDQVVPETYRTLFPFPDTLDKALRLREGNEKKNFSELYKLAEEIKENRKKRYKRKQSNDAEEVREKGILDLLTESSVSFDNWPSITLKSSENNELRIISSERRLDDTPLPNMDPLNVDDIYNSVREELEKGFDKLNQMQEYLFHKEQIANIALDYLILEGNSSHFRLIKQIAKKEAQAKEIIFDPEKLKKSVGLGAVEYGRTLTAISDLRVHGIHKLNYPICRSALTHFVPIFDRWTLLKPNTTITPENSEPIIETERASSQITLFEFFGWDLKTRVTQGENRVVANLTVPNEDEAFQNAQFWTYCLELRCDAEAKASLWYNHKVGNEKDGSDFKYVWDIHRKCENFSYT